MAAIPSSVLSPSPSPSPAGSTTSGIVSPPGFPSSTSPIRLNDISLFQLQLTVPEDKLGFLTTLLQEDFGYITKLQASLAWVLVFRVAASQLADTLKSLSALGVGVYFGVLDVIPLWFSLPMFLGSQSNLLTSSPSSFNSGTSLSSFIFPTTQTITQSLKEHAINNSGEQPTPTTGTGAATVTPLCTSQNLLDVGQIVSPSTSEQHVAQTYLPFLLDPFRAEMKEILHGASKENKDALERYRSGRTLFASLKTNHAEHPPKAGTGLTLPPTAAMRKNSDESSRSPPINRDKESSGSGTPSPRDAKKSRRQTPSNIESVFRRFSVEIDSRDQSATTQPAPTADSPSGLVKVVGFNAPVPPLSPQPVVVVGFSVPTTAAPPPPTTSTTSPKVPPPQAVKVTRKLSGGASSAAILPPAAVVATYAPASTSAPLIPTTTAPSPTIQRSPRGDDDEATTSGGSGKAIRVFFTDGSSRGLHVSETETVNSLIRRLLRKFNIPQTQTHLWRLYERIDDNDRLLREDEIVLTLYETLQSSTNLFATPERCLLLKSIHEESRQEKETEGSLKEHQQGMGKVFTDIRNLGTGTKERKSRSFFERKKKNVT